MVEKYMRNNEQQDPFDLVFPPPDPDLDGGPDDIDDDFITNAYEGGYDESV